MGYYDKENSKIRIDQVKIVVCFSQYRNVLLICLIACKCFYTHDD